MTFARFVLGHDDTIEDMVCGLIAASASARRLKGDESWQVTDRHRTDLLRAESLCGEVLHLVRVLLGKNAL